MHRLSSSFNLNQLRRGAGQLKYRTLAAGLGFAMLTATLAVGSPADATLRGGWAGRTPSSPLPQALSRLNHGLSAVSGKPATSSYCGYLHGVSVLSASDAWAVGWKAPISNCSNDSRSTLIEHWNGTTWQRVASPNPAGTEDAELDAVKAISPTDLWAVGYYYCPGGSGGACATRTLTEHWDGKSWKIVPSPNPTSSASDPLNALYGVAAVSATDVWAVGGYDSKPGSSGYDDSAGLVEHWDGKNWKIIASPRSESDVELTGVTAVSATDIWAVGDDNATKGEGGGTVVEHWNGHTWKTVPSPSPTPDYSNLHGVDAVSAKDVWAVGNDGVKTAPILIEHWNGAKWRHVSSPVPNGADSIDGLASVDAMSADNVWAVGQYGGFFSSSWDTLVEHWNGKSWSIVASPNPKAYNFSYLLGVSGSSASNIWSVGAAYNGSSYGPALSEKWNGHKWVINSGS